MSDDIEFLNELFHHQLERDAICASTAAGAAWSGDVMTLHDLKRAVALLEANNVPAFEGYYTARVHPAHWWRARRCASRLKYRGGRKYRQAVRELRSNELLSELVISIDPTLNPRNPGSGEGG